LRKIVGLKDEQYNLTIVRSNLFAPIVDAFKTNKRRYNYFVENFYSDFENISYVKTFNDLKLRYDAHRDKKERILSDR
jgi:hypothetical protein